MHFQEIRRAAAQGTISLPPPMDSEGLEDLAVLKSCLKVIRELSGFRYAFAKDAMAETFAPLMASVEAKNELERQGLKVSLKSYFLSLILKDLENPDIVTIDNYINALFNCADAAANGPITVQTVVNVANSSASRKMVLIGAKTRKPKRSRSFFSRIPFPTAKPFRLNWPDGKNTPKN